MPLHVDHRPQTFGEIVGNESTVASLRGVIESGDRPHTYLFHGPSGCGKTTLARIVAGHLGCPARMANGTINPDFVEINAGDNRGIDTARGIIAQMSYPPIMPENESRVWVLDEVHMGTRDFQNGMLKPLEEPPAHAYFILCTTDPEKLIKTLRSRCSEFRVESQPENALVALVNRVAVDEGVEIPDSAIRKIAEAAAGSPRDALVILGQIIDLPPSEMESFVVTAGAADPETIDLLRAITKGPGNWPAVAQILQTMKTADWEKVRLGVMGYSAAIMLKRKGAEPDPWLALVMHHFRVPNHYNGKNGIIQMASELFS